MRFRIRFANQLVGIFVLVAFAFLLFILASMGINQHWFEKRHDFSSTFPTARGLNVGMNVTFRGFAIGKVTNISLTDQNAVLVRFYIRDEYYPRVYDHSVLQLTTNPLGLGGGLVFHPGVTPSKPLPDKSIIPSWDDPAAKKWRDEGLVTPSAEEDAIGNLLGEVGPLITKVNELLDSTQSILVTVNGSLNGTNHGPLGQALANANSLVGGMSQTVHQLNGSPMTSITGVLKNLNDMTTSLASLTAELKTAKGLIPTLLGAKGSIATLLDDRNALFNRIDDTMASLQETMADVKKLADLAANSTPQIQSMIQQGQQALTTTQDVLEGVKNNPLIRGGIPQHISQPGTFRSYRDAQF